MREHRTTIRHRDRAPYAAWTARINGATCIFLPLLLVLSWSILAEHDGDRLTHKLGVACSDMVARMRQAQTSGGDFTQHWPVAHPECWPARAKTRSAAVGNWAGATLAQRRVRGPAANEVGLKGVWLGD